MKKISIITPCYNEEANVAEVYQRVKAVFAQQAHYTYEHIFIDNASTDNTIAALKTLAGHDKNIKIIINARNFGYIRSSFHALLQGGGDAVILLAADLQDPPELIHEFLKQWEAGFKIVAGIKPASEETFLMSAIRKSYYHFITRIADIRLIKNFMGFGLYDKSVIKILRTVEDPYPYFRGLISEIGFKIAEVPYHQPNRKRGITKNNFYTLYDLAILGITNHSKLPLRIATIGGFCLSIISFIIASLFFIAKLLFWNHFTVGIAPILIGLFFFASVQLLFIGLLGEYVLSIHTQVQKRPLVIEEERINFETN